MKPKLFTLFLVLVASVGTIFAERVQIGDLYYNLDAGNRTAEVTYQQWSENNYSGLTSANIPSSVTDNNLTYSVTSIGKYAFEYCSSLTSVTIPNSVTSIEKQAFYQCRGLTKVNITDIAAWCNIAFGDYYANPLCYAKHLFVNDVEVTELAIPNSVTSIGNYAFEECSSLTSVTIPNSVTSIGLYAFSACSSLTSVTIPNSVTSIGQSAFSGCSSLTSVTIPNSVTSIGQSAFSGCTSLTSVTIPNSVTSIGDRAIYGCSSLTSVTAPAELFEAPEENWPYYPKHMENVCVNAGVLTENAFGFIARSYKTLKSLDLSATTNTNLADEAFKDFYNIQSLKLPANLTRISYMAVAGCKNLLAIDIPASVEEIDQSAFEDCRSIQTITFGGVQPSAVAGRAHAAASQLRKIGNWAFYNAHELQHLEIPEGVEEIGDGAFYGCTYLEDLVLPASVRAIGDNCFALCSKLAYIVVSSTTPPDIQAKTFYDVKRQIPVYVPDDSVEAYQDDQYWGEFDIQGVSNIQTAVETVSSDASRTTKFIRDGQLLIINNGKTFTVQGQQLQ